MTSTRSASSGGLTPMPVAQPTRTRSRAARGGSSANLVLRLADVGGERVDQRLARAARPPPPARDQLVAVQAHYRDVALPAAAAARVLVVHVAQAHPLDDEVGDFGHRDVVAGGG